MFAAPQGDRPELVEVGEVGDGEAFRSGLVVLAAVSRPSCSNLPSVRGRGQATLPFTDVQGSYGVAVDNVGNTSVVDTVQFVR